jgi:hypothetical protein
MSLPLRKSFNLGENVVSIGAMILPQISINPSPAGRSHVRGTGFLCASSESHFLVSDERVVKKN